MFFFLFRKRHKYVLGSKSIYATLNDKAASEMLNLEIYVDYFKFLWLPTGCSFFKKCRLMNSEGVLIDSRQYSPEIKKDIEDFKKNLKIPYFKLWKGRLLFLAVGLLIAVFLALKQKKASEDFGSQKQNLAEAVKQIKAGQLYGVLFKDDAERIANPRLLSGWVRIQRIEGDTIFVQHSKKIVEQAFLKSADFKSIKPSSEEDWSGKIEKIDYKLFKEAVKDDQIYMVNLIPFQTGKEEVDPIISLITADN